MAKLKKKRKRRETGGAHRSGSSLRIAVEMPWDASAHMGTGAYSETMARSLAVAARDARIMLITAPGAARTISLDNVSYHSPEPTDVKSEGFRQVALPALLERLAPDCLFAPATLLPMVKVCPMVMTVHDLTFIEHPEYYAPGLVSYLNAYFEPSLRAADHVLAISGETKASLIRHFGVAEDRVTVVHQPVREALREPLDEDCKRARLDELGVTSLFFFHVSNLAPHKNVTFVVEAFQRFLASRPGAKHSFVVAGGGVAPNRPPDLEVCARRHGVADRFRYVGRVTDDQLKALYQGCSALLFPSLVEGWGLPVAEANALQVRVLASPNVPAAASSQRLPLDKETWASAMADEDSGKAEVPAVSAAEAGRKLAGLISSVARTERERSLGAFVSGERKRTDGGFSPVGGPGAAVSHSAASPSAPSTARRAASVREGQALNSGGTEARTLAHPAACEPASRRLTARRTGKRSTRTRSAAKASMAVTWWSNNAPPGTSLHVIDQSIVQALRELGCEVGIWDEGGRGGVLVRHCQPHAFERPPGHDLALSYLATTSWNTIPKMYVPHLRQCDHIFVWNSQTDDSCKRMGLPSSIWPLAVDPTCCGLNVRKRKEFTLVNVSQGAAFKNNALLARSFQDAFGNDPSVRFVKVAGVESFVEGFPTAPPENVELIPDVRDRGRLFEIVLSAHVYVSASYQESFGLAALEALACGLPVLHTDVPVMHDFPFSGRVELVPSRRVLKPEILQVYHRPGWQPDDFVDVPYVHEADHGALVQRLRELRRNYGQYQERATANRAFFLERCTWKEMAKRHFLPVVDRLLEARHRRARPSPVDKRSTARRVAGPGAPVVGCRADWRSPTGFGEVARATFEALRLAGMPPHAVPVVRNPIQVRELWPDVPLRSLEQADIWIHHMPPYQYDLSLPGKHVAPFVWETDRLPDEWVPILNRLDEIWVPAGFVEHVLARGGVTAEVVRMPHPIDTAKYSPGPRRPPGGTLPPGFDPTWTVFLYVGTWDVRKRPDILIKSFCNAFQDTDRAVLVIKSYVTGDPSKDREILHDWLAQCRFGSAHVCLFHSILGSLAMRDLHRCATVFATASRGEGFCLPAVQSMSCGKPVIAPGWSAFTDYAAVPVEFRLCNVPEKTRLPGYASCQRWAVVDEEDLSSKLVWAHRNRAPVAELGRSARDWVLQHASYEAVGPLLKRRVSMLHAAPSGERIGGRRR